VTNSIEILNLQSDVKDEELLDYFKEVGEVCNLEWHPGKVILSFKTSEIAD